MVECMTQDRGVAGSSLTGVTVLVLEQDTLTVAPRKTHPDITEKLLTGM